MKHAMMKTLILYYTILGLCMLVVNGDRRADGLQSNVRKYSTVIIVIAAIVHSC
jgi:hypothetical protein